MKELSIEEKAKRYDEAKARMSRAYNSNRCTIGFMNEIFPELRESEDERIRKAIINVFASHKDYEVFFGVSVKDILAWLEKQEEKNKQTFWEKCNHCEYFDGYDICLHKKNFGSVTNESKENCKNNKFYFEKQGEQKFDDKVEPKFKVGDTIQPKDRGHEPWQIMQVDILDKEYRFKGGYVIHFSQENNYELVEKKPTDEVEPKFHEGDWIIGDKDNTVHQVKTAIENVSNGKYAYDLIDGGYISTSHESDYHLWTIQDAKDGDVLYTSSTASNEVFIFKGLTIEGYIKCYCSYDSEDKYREGKYHFIGRPTFMTHPATKDQRDLLFQKMKEAGYEWDAEQKQLKKIDNEIEIPFGAKDSYLQEATYYIPKGFHAEIEGNNVVIKKGEQKPAWSEEDETTLNGILSCIKHCQDEDIEARYNGNHYVDPKRYEPMSDWLKSLKDRVQPQPEQEWSEEVEDAISLLKDIAEEQEKDYCPYNANDLRKAAQYLETCRPQPTWKPSDEQIEALKTACDEHWEPDGLDPLYTLYQDLKKLRKEDV